MGRSLIISLFVLIFLLFHHIRRKFTKILGYQMGGHPNQQLTNGEPPHLVSYWGGGSPSTSYWIGNPPSISQWLPRGPIQYKSFTNGPTRSPGPFLAPEQGSSPGTASFFLFFIFFSLLSREAVLRSSSFSVVLLFLLFTYRLDSFFFVLFLSLRLICSFVRLIYLSSYFRYRLSIVRLNYSFAYLSYALLRFVRASTYFFHNTNSNSLVQGSVPYDSYRYVTIDYASLRSASSIVTTRQLSWGP